MLSNLKTFIRELIKPDKVQLSIKNIIKEKKKANKDFFFIQIGSNDGKNGDPLFKLVNKYNLKGILVEPVPNIFEKLKHNYREQKQLFFENSAIGNSGKSLKFYRLKETPNLPVWYNQLGSFKKEVILKHEFAIPNIEKLIIEEKVSVLTFESLIKKYNVSAVSFLHIDSEGYDYEILKTIDFKKHLVENILFEYKHLSQNECDDCIKYLKNNGFTKMFKYGGDIFCSRK